MKVDRLVSACAAATLLLGVAGSANANIVTVTDQGVVTSGVDQTDLFGLGDNADLTGQTYTIVFRIDDSVAAYQGDIPGIRDQIFGGTYYPSPRGDQSPLSAVLTINNHTVVVPGRYQGAVWQQTLVPPNTHAEEYEVAIDERDDGINTYHDDIWDQIISYAYPMMTTEDYHVPFSYTIHPGDTVIAGFTDQVTSDATGGYLINVNAKFGTTSVTVADAVPEPATWAMLILGVGMIGFAARRRNEATAVAA